MTVLCINDKIVRLPKNNNKPAPVFLGEYSVVKTKELNKMIEPGFRAEGVYYQLAEFADMWYHSQMFVQLPEQSADEMSEESKEAITNIETQPI